MSQGCWVFDPWPYESGRDEPRRLTARTYTYRYNIYYWSLDGASDMYVCTYTDIYAYNYIRKQYAKHLHMYGWICIDGDYRYGYSSC